MQLVWYGNASVVLKNEDGAIAFDAFSGIDVGELKNPPEKLSFEKEFREIEKVFVTHGHFDHIYHLPRLYGDLPTDIFCTKTPAEKLRHKGIPENKLNVIYPDWSGSTEGFTVKAFAGKHCRFDIPIIFKTVFNRRFFKNFGHTLRLLLLDFTYSENGEILFYEISCKGKRIQIMGSMNLSKKVKYPTGADVLIFPLQGRSDQDTYALHLIKRLKPKLVYLDHYNNSFPPITNDIDTSAFAKNLKDTMGIECIPLEKAHFYDI